MKLFSVPLQEAEAIVYPDKILDVLQVLKQMNQILSYGLSEQIVQIWADSGIEISMVANAMTRVTVEPKLTEPERRPLSLKRKRHNG